MKAIEIYNSTRDANNQFKTGYVITKGTKYYTIKYLTNIQGDRDRYYRVMILGIMTIEELLEDIQLGLIDPYKTGEPIK